jgi:hypothetical protein
MQVCSRETPLALGQEEVSHGQDLVRNTLNSSAGRQFQNSGPPFGIPGYTNTNKMKTLPLFAFLILISVASQAATANRFELGWDHHRHGHGYVFVQPCIPLPPPVVFITCHPYWESPGYRHHRCDERYERHERCEREREREYERR